ncbi:hypothetical protein L3N51_02012 [Metallosphaera sp. J1]|uniref:flagellar protein FlaJ n=1 Tax=Metallosphaera javensis (ex Hofmann et al. 2022) TaxID=99938 RepID=UPI001EE01044|nr:flagellar protein FlaJ [Metallosphaera javensis (ex Hofmann et al. 2022)]MCG3109717.1 hypothetical protein [Metallosphaera javensis (ex Hofmann et al. 2022)]
MQLRRQDEVDSKFIFLVAYILALFTADLPPENIIVTLSGLKYFGEYSKTFSRLATLIHGYRYKFSTAINIMSSKVYIKPFREFMIRFSQALSHGDEMISFLNREIDMTLNDFNADMNRKIESMNNFLAIYGSLSSSLVFLMVNLTLVSILFDVGTSALYLLSLAMVAVIGLLTLVVYMLYRPEVYVILKRNEKLVGVVGVTLAGIIMLLQRNYISIAIAGGVLIGTGIFFRTKERRLSTLERHYVAFVTYFSRTYHVVSNLMDTFLSVMRGDLGSMRPLVTSSLNRLKFGVKKSLIFEMMGEESGSVLILMMNRIISATIELGGNVKEVGETVSRIGTTLLNLRARREQNGRAFEASVFAMQGASSAIGGSLLALIQVFETIFSSNAINTIFTLGQVSIPQLSLLLLAILVALSFANGISIAIAYGKTFYSSLYFVGILLIITALSFHFTYVLTQGIFSGIFQGLPTITSVPGNI